MRWKSDAVAPGSSVAKFCSSVSGREPTTCSLIKQGRDYHCQRCIIHAVVHSTKRDRPGSCGYSMRGQTAALLAALQICRVCMSTFSRASTRPSSLLTDAVNIAGAGSPGRPVVETLIVSKAAGAKGALSSP